MLSSGVAQGTWLNWHGQVIIRVRDGKNVKHEGIKVEFVGSIGSPSSSTRAAAS